MKHSESVLDDRKEQAMPRAAGERIPLQRHSPLSVGIAACLMVGAFGPGVLPGDGVLGRIIVQDARGTPSGDRLEAAFAELEQSGVSAIVAVSDDGGPIVVREFGALKDDGIPAGSTQVDIGSITKTVTGVMVLKLIEQGKVRLDETLAEIFPNVPADKAAITVHHLLTHSAGFVDAVGDDAERLNREDFLHRAFGSPLVSPPGERYHYSNVGFAILAAIVEDRSGKSYDAYLQEDVLRGTGLENIGYMSVYDDERSLRARASSAPEFPSSKGQTIMEANWGGHEPLWNLIGNGGLVSTAEEFIRFRQLVTAARIVPAELVELSQVKHIPEDEAGTSYYGYGLVVQDDPEVGRIYWHNGGNGIFSAEWGEFVDHGDVIFTAAADSSAGDAFSAMAIMQAHLYGASPTS
jgi:CubicO group peptidase (beta-lactamase class C family)